MGTRRLLRRAIGGAKRDRTADLLHAMQALSQLSYSPTAGANYRTRRALLQTCARLAVCVDIVLGPTLRFIVCFPISSPAVSRFSPRRCPLPRRSSRIFLSVSPAE